MVTILNFNNTSNATIDFTKKVPYITFPALSEIPFIKHGFSTKLGGVSKGHMATMNLGYGGPLLDDPSNVLENFLLITESMGIDPNTIVRSWQVHKTNIRIVTKEDCGKGLYRERDYNEIDGLISNTPGVTLVTNYADCVPLFFVDPVKKAIGLSHSGWRGTVQKMGKVTVEHMTEAFASNPDDIICVIGPSICEQCFEVGEEVAAQFNKIFNLSDDNNYIISPNNKGRYQCDLWAANKAVLKEAGIKEDNIHTSGVCTSCHDELLFSHRKSQGKRGSLAAFLTIK
ncbi:MAG TPA: peptidoglycan editing factor PgeF [Clostridiales bacterium]|nr:peptidoglycan editing factor PgeF [Clostridiales bacterium]